MFALRVRAPCHARGPGLCLTAHPHLPAVVLVKPPSRVGLRPVLLPALLLSACTRLCSVQPPESPYETLSPSTTQSPGKRKAPPKTCQAPRTAGLPTPPPPWVPPHAPLTPPAPAPQVILLLLFLWARVLKFLQARCTPKNETAESEHLYIFEILPNCRTDGFCPFILLPPL